MKRSLIYSVLRQQQKKIIAIMVLGVFWSLRDIATPYIVKNILDSVGYLSFKDVSEIIFRSLILIIFIWVLMEVCMRVQGSLMLRAIPSIRRDLCEKLLKRVKGYPYSFFLENMTGNLTDKINGASQGIETLISICLLSFIPIFSHMVFSLIIIATISLKLFFLFLGWMILHLGISWKMGIKSLVRIEKLAHTRSHLHGRIVDSFLNIFTIKTFCREKYEGEYIKNYLNKELLASQNSQKFLEKIRLMLGISSIFMLAATLLASYTQWKQGTLSVGSLTLVIILLLNLTSFLWYLSMELIRFNEEMGRVKENIKVLFSGMVEKGGSVLLTPPIGKIEVQNISYAYDKPLLKNLTFSASPGKKIALTGLSGSGKTTFINLLLSHLTMQKGEIILDGVNIKQLPPETLRENFSIVPQNPTLFHRSIKENIRYGNLLATDGEIIHVAKIANCHDFILSLQKGYDTLVGERGDKLSGGQKQRIAIARALIKKSPILILDEPLSNLDHQTAIRTLENILKETKDRTLIMITHNHRIASLMDEMVEIS